MGGGVAGAAVLGMVERGGRVQGEVVPNVKSKTLRPRVIDSVEVGSSPYTDALKSYTGLDVAYDHRTIDHAERYVNGRVHTNTIENFWSLVKRGLHGTYVSVEPYHLFRYLDERVFTFNERDRCSYVKRTAQFAGLRCGLRSARGRGDREACSASRQVAVLPSSQRGRRARWSFFLVFAASV